MNTSAVADVAAAGWVSSVVSGSELSTVQVWLAIRPLWSPSLPNTLIVCRPSARFG